jgi:predicted HNH restriction endonuclease
LISRKELIDTKKLEKKAYCYQFTEDVEFDDVSPAASIIWGSNRNGKRDFTPNGKKVRIGQNIRSVNKPTVLKPDSIKTVETPAFAKQPLFKEEDDELAFPEGKEIYELHKSKERSNAVVDLAKKKAKERDPSLCCSVCDFSFSKEYGVELGENFIEAHHTKPLSEIIGEVETKVEDLALVCSNCHRMLHRRRPWLSISGLKSILNGK